MRHASVHAKIDISLHSVRLISIRLDPTAMSGPLTRALIRGAQPKKRLVGPVAQPYKEEVWTGSSGYEVHRCRHRSPLKTLD